MKYFFIPLYGGLLFASVLINSSFALDIMMQKDDDTILQEAIEIWLKGDEEKAKSIFLRLSEKNNALAFTHLGVMHFNSGDKKGAAELFQKAVDLNEPTAMFHLASMKLSGDGIVQDVPGGFMLMKKVADLSEDPAACFQLGKLYYRGLGTEQDKESAFRYWKMAAESQPGHVLAQYVLGTLYAETTNRNEEQNRDMYRYLELAAKQRFVDAWRSLGNLYHEGSGLPEPNYMRALDCYLTAESIAPFDATEFNIGLIYRFGRGVPPNEKIAEKWFKRSADKGNVTACYYLGEIYSEWQRYDEARKYLKIAADRQLYQAYNLLGFLDLHGHGVPTSEQNKVHAFEWFQKAAKQGSAIGQYQLAYCYQNGIGTPANTTLAKEWMTKAAAQKNLDAMRFLGIASLSEEENTVVASHTAKRSIYTEIIDAYDRKLNATTKTATDKNNTLNAESSMILLTLPDEIKLADWNFDVEAHEQGLRKNLVVDRDGCFRWKTDKYIEMPLEENLEEINLTIRTVNLQNEEFALKSITESKFVPCNKEMTQKLLVSVMNMIPNEKVEVHAWKIRSDLYFLITADFSSAWHSRHYTFITVNANNDMVSLAQFDSFPTIHDAALIEGVIRLNPEAMNNLAVKVKNGEINRSSTSDDFVLRLLQSAAEKGCSKAYFNLGVFYQNCGDHKQANRFFALAKQN